jgi:SAM-dependent methyltransferase
MTGNDQRHQSVDEKCAKISRHNHLTIISKARLFTPQARNMVKTADNTPMSKGKRSDASFLWWMLLSRLPSSRGMGGHIAAFSRLTLGLSGPCGSRGFKSVLKRLRKQLGQHLLKNPDVVRRIVDSANIQPSEIVLEIGPGTGNMTVHMLQKARAVFAVELDERMFETVNTRVQHM